MEDFKTLQLLDKIQFLFKKIGVDYSVMRQILQVKLLMDERKTPTFYNQSAKKDQDQKFGYIKSLWIYVLLGLILIPLMTPLDFSFVGLLATSSPSALQFKCTSKSRNARRTY